MQGGPFAHFGGSTREFLDPHSGMKFPVPFAKLQYQLLNNVPLTLVLQIPPEVRCLDGMFLGSSHTSSRLVSKEA